MRNATSSIESAAASQAPARRRRRFDRHSGSPAYFLGRPEVIWSQALHRYR